MDLVRFKGLTFTFPISSFFQKGFPSVFAKYITLLDRLTILSSYAKFKLKYIVTERTLILALRSFTFRKKDIIAYSLVYSREIPSKSR